MMRKAGADRFAAGDKHMFVVEGMELFGPADKNYFHDATHPNDEGNVRLAQRLAPIMRKALFDGATAAAPAKRN